MDKRVMVVEDEVEIEELLKAGLEREGFQVVGFHNGNDALNYMRNHQVDLVISDIRMPGMDGTELFFELRKIDPFLQVIFMTAYPNLENITQMLETGAADFVIKPFSFKHMKGIVHEAFEKIERWRSLRKGILQNRDASQGINKPGGKGPV